MEDRYLFKARSVYEINEWVVGYYIVFNGKDSIFEKEPEKYHDIEAGKVRCGNKIVEVMPETVCQCTGRKDKNGKLIFENDIMEAHLVDIFPEVVTRECVVWHENGWCMSEPGCDDYGKLDDFYSENFEVIGNKIDNPELLEGNCDGE